MASAARYLPKQVPSDKWALREKLALATSVKRSGDNNWISVSRAVRPYGESNRPADWFSQKNCALQYSDLLEKVETPKRKRGERESSSSVETPGDIIMRKLTIERIEELKRVVQEEEEKYHRLKKDVKRVLAGEADTELDLMQVQINSEKNAREDADKKWADELIAREELLRNKKLSLGFKVKVDVDESSQGSLSDTVPLEEDSNLSQNSVSTTLSASSQDVKPVVSTTEFGVAGIKQELDLEAAGDIKLEPGEAEEIVAAVAIKEELIEAGDGKDYTTGGKCDGTSTKNSASNVVQSEVTAREETPKADSLGESDVQVKANLSELDKKSKKELKITKKFKTPEKEPDVTKKLKTPEKESPIVRKNKTPDKEPKGDTKDIDQEERDSISEDNGSSLDTFHSLSETKNESADSEKEIFVQVVDDKEELNSVSECTGEDLDDMPLSPASSIMSNDTDGGSISIIRGRGRWSRGGKNKRGRGRPPSWRGRHLVEDDKTKESETSSKAESSDDEAGIHESDDTASSITGRNQLSFCESLPNSPASIAPGDTEDEKTFKTWKKSIMLVWRAATNHKYSNVFLQPVREEIAPGYRSIVHRPMDLATIKKYIETGGIRTTAEFQRDMMLMFTNAIMYNNSDHDVSHMANEMYDDVMRHIEQYVNTQIMVSGGDAKLLRTSRRSEVQSDKEDDPKRKRTNSDQQDSGGKAKKRKI